LSHVISRLKNIVVGRGQGAAAPNGGQQLRSALTRTDSKITVCVNAQRQTATEMN